MADLSPGQIAAVLYPAGGGTLYARHPDDNNKLPSVRSQRAGLLFEISMPNLQHIVDNVLAQTYADVLPGRFDSAAADVMLLAIGLQESRFEHRQQIGGPARSFWQFEKGGGVAGVLTHPSTAKHAHAVCVLRGILPTRDSVYARMLDDDLLGCAFARLLLYSDPKPLPNIGDEEAAWGYYLRNWRPGKPHRGTWEALYAEAVQAARN